MLTKQLYTTQTNFELIFASAMPLLVDSNFYQRPLFRPKSSSPVPLHDDSERKIGCKQIRLTKMLYNNCEKKDIEHFESIMGKQYVSANPAITASYMSKAIMGLEASMGD
ncbi:MAG: hypothetical protein ACTSYU_13435, partial [Promethearchaeota archaeon]